MSATVNTVPIPVTLIGGFLGSGKTSLLNHVLSENHGVRAAVLVNDFGAVNIDARLVVGVEGETVSLANGCICCTIRDDLVKACLGLLKRAQPPEHVLIELSGVSDPVPVLNTFMETELEMLFSLSSTLAVVDAEQFSDVQGTMSELVHVQIAAADMVVINKIDLVPPDELSATRKRVSKMGEGAGIIEVSYGRVPLELIFEPVSRPFESCRQDPVLNADKRVQSNAFSTWHWTSDQPLSLPGLRSVLGTLPAGVFRAKGLICFEELPSRKYVLQMVGRRYTIEETGRWGSELPLSEIVLIGASGEIDGEALQRSFDSCIGVGDESNSPILKLSRHLFPDEQTSCKRTNPLPFNPLKGD